MKTVIGALSEALERNEPVVLATIIEVKGASPAQPGFKMVVWADGRVVGNVGGGGLEQHVRAEAAAALRDGRSRLVHYALREEGANAVGVACGGDVRLFLEVYAPVPLLLIVGGGHLGQPLAEMARLAGWTTQIVDVRPERATLSGWDPALVTPWTYVVIATETHQSDQEMLRQAVDTPAAYIGMIGSRRKVRTIFEQLLADGVPPERLASVRAPIGLDLGGRDPAEIAVAILAELIQVRYGGPGGPRMLGLDGLRATVATGEEQLP